MLLFSQTHLCAQQLKVASLAPEGSIWIEHFEAFAREVKERTEGNVTIKIYPGGVMGDDLAMYRKMRAGQLQGGGFTMTGIAEIVPDFRVMAIPYYFSSYDEVDRVSRAMRPFFEKQFHDRGLELMAVTEVGFIYTMSSSPATTLADLRQSKSWIPSGDPLTASYLDTLDITPIPLSIPDVLSSLQTGLVDTVYTSLYGAIVMQWFTRANHITDFPFGYAYGALAFSDRALARISQEYRRIIREAADTHFNALNQATRETNGESRQVLIQNGVRFVAPSPKMLEKLAIAREATISEETGTLFSRKAYDEMAAALGRRHKE